jgi:hypothetical protein
VTLREWYFYFRGWGHTASESYRRAKKWVGKSHRDYGAYLNKLDRTATPFFELLRRRSNAKA